MPSVQSVQIDKNSPPFALGTGTPAQVARQMVRAYESINAAPPTAQYVWQVATASLNVPHTSPFYKAGRDLADMLDAGQGTGIANGYHNTQHYLEVLGNTTQLILRNNKMAADGIVLSPEQSGKTLFAAFSHDYAYEKGGNVDTQGQPAPYRLEKISFSKVEPLLQKHGAAAGDIADVKVMLCGTDVSPASNAGAFVRAAHAHHFEGAPKPASSPVLAEVQPLLENKHLCRMSGTLSDADILSSAGLTVEYADIQSQRLGAEWGRPMGPKDTIGFLTYVAGNRFTTPAASFFQPNMDAIRQKAEASFGQTIEPALKAAQKGPKGAPSVS